MNYYILPKKNSIIDINPTISLLDSNNITPIISHNVISYLSEINEILHNSIKNPDELNEYNIEFIYQMINP